MLAKTTAMRPSLVLYHSAFHILFQAFSNHLESLVINQWLHRCNQNKSDWHTLAYNSSWPPCTGNWILGILKAVFCYFLWRNKKFLSVSFTAACWHTTAPLLNNQVLKREKLKAADRKTRNNPLRFIILRSYAGQKLIISETISKMLEIS